MHTNTKHPHRSNSSHQASIPPHQSQYFWMWVSFTACLLGGWVRWISAPQHWEIIGILGLIIVIWWTIWLLYHHHKKRQYRTTQEYIKSLSPQEFEWLVATIMKHQQFTKVRTTIVGKDGTIPGKWDGGIDIEARKWKTRYIVQCKKYSSRHFVGEAVIRDLYGVCHTYQPPAQWILATTWPISDSAKLFCQKHGIITRDYQRIIAAHTNMITSS